MLASVVSHAELIENLQQGLIDDTVIEAVTYGDNATGSYCYRRYLDELKQRIRRGCMQMSLSALK